MNAYEIAKWEAEQTGRFFEDYEPMPWSKKPMKKWETYTTLPDTANISKVNACYGAKDWVKSANVYRANRLDARVSWCDANKAWLSYEGSSYRVKMVGAIPTFQKPVENKSAILFNKKLLEQNPKAETGFKKQVRWNNCELPADAQKFVIQSNAAFLKASVKGSVDDCAGQILGRKWWIDLEGDLCLKTTDGKIIVDGKQDNRFLDAIKASYLYRAIICRIEDEKFRNYPVNYPVSVEDARAALGI